MKRYSEAAWPALVPPRWARSGTQPLAMPCTAKKPTTSRPIPATTSGSTSGSVSSAPTIATAAPIGMTVRRP